MMRAGTDKRTYVLSRPSCIYTQIFNPKKTVYFHFSGSKNFFFNLFYIKGIMQLFSADPEKVKKQASKVAHNWPKPFYFTVQPRPQLTAQN